MSPTFLLLFILWSPTALAAADTEPTLIRCTGTSFDVDLYGRIVLADARENTVTLLSPSGTVEVTVGGSGWGNEQFDSPAGVWTRNGIDVFVADYHNHRIQRFDRNLNFVSSLTTRESGNPDVRFGFPTDVALSRLGELYVCDSENSRVLKFNRLNYVERSIGGIAAGKGRLRSPTNVEIGPGDKLYVLDGKNIQVYDGFGNYLRTIGEGMFAEKPVIAADSRGLVVLDGSGILFFDEEDRPAGGATPGELWEEVNGEVRGLVVSGEDVYLLTENGIWFLKGVRPIGLTK